MQVLSENRKAKFAYEFLEEFEAGIVLRGHEIKAILAGKVDLSGAYVDISAGAAWLKLAHVEFPKGIAVPWSTADLDPDRPRKLLLHSHEIRGLKKALTEKGLTCIPIRVVYTDDRPRKVVKVILQLARGRNTQDKREYLKERDIKRETAREGF